VERTLFLRHHDLKPTHLKRSPTWPGLYGFDAVVVGQDFATLTIAADAGDVCDRFLSGREHSQAISRMWKVPDCLTKDAFVPPPPHAAAD